MPRLSTTATAAASWEPETPPPSVLRDPDSAAARRYLARSGYGSDELAAVVASLARALATASGDLVEVAIDVMRARPPLSVLQMSPLPPRWLSPEDLGARLRPAGSLWLDVLSGARWSARQDLRPEQAGAVVTAAALYRLLGLGAPVARLVDLDGSPAVAWPELSAWVPGLSGVLGGVHRAELTAASVADAWLGNVAPRRGLLARPNPIPGFPAVLRPDLTGCMGWSSAGRRASWGAVDVPVIDGPPEVLAIAYRRILAVPVTKIRRAVAIGDPMPEIGAGRIGTLIARREILRSRSETLIG